MATFFVKNQKVALSIDNNAQESKKQYFDCCPSCGRAVAEEKGFLVSTPLTKSELNKQGVLVSSSQFCGGMQ